MMSDLKTALRSVTRLGFLLMIGTLVSCGFHFRQYQDVPPALQMVQFIPSGTDFIFAEQLRKGLSAYGIYSTEPSPQALQLHIDNIAIADQQIGIGSNSQVRQIQVNFQFSFVLTFADGTPLFPPQVINVVRSYNIDNNTMLANDSGRAIVVNALHHEAISQLITRLRSPQITAAVVAAEQTLLSAPAPKVIPVPSSKPNQVN